MADQMLEQSISPVLFDLTDNRVQNAKFEYGIPGLLVKHIKTNEIILEATWDEIKHITIVCNSSTLGLVHFILEVMLLGSLIGAIFLPHVLFHLFPNITNKWAGFVELEFNNNHTVRITPMGWTRLGFHINESKLSYENILNYAQNSTVNIIDFVDYKTNN